MVARSPVSRRGQHTTRTDGVARYDGQDQPRIISSSFLAFVPNATLRAQWSSISSQLLLDSRLSISCPSPTVSPMERTTAAVVVPSNHHQLAWISFSSLPALGPAPSEGVLLVSSSIIPRIYSLPSKPPADRPGWTSSAFRG